MAHVDRTIAPVALRNNSSDLKKLTPDQHIVCAIPSPRATAKMAVSQ
jgi:hypothetical protein